MFYDDLDVNDYDEFSEDEDFFYDDPSYSYLSEYQMLVESAIKDCLPSVVSQMFSFRTFLGIILLSLTFRVLSRLARKPYQIHLLSALSGWVIAYSFFERASFYVFLNSVWGFVAVTSSKRNKFGATCIAIVAYMALCEFWWLSSEVLHQIRGTQLVMGMKMLCYAHEMSSASNSISFMEYLGYTLNVSSLIFGPYISLDQYRQVLQRSPPSLKELRNTTKVLLCSILFFLSSSCGIMIIPTLVDNIWWTSYTQALSFRLGHYFVGFFSETSCLLSGISLSEKTNDGDKTTPSWRLPCVVPSKVELPRSLVDVVVSWNLPMHQWLKKFIYTPSRKFGIGVAVLMTYFVSSLLHGLNFQISAVLLSIGIFAFVENLVRSGLADMFEACVAARSCPQDCRHHYKSTNKFVLLTNAGFTILSIWSLAYLGCVFDSSSSAEMGYSMDHTLAVWSSLSYAAHWFYLGLVVLYIVSIR